MRFFFAGSTRWRFFIEGKTEQRISTKFPTLNLNAITFRIHPILYIYTHTHTLNFLYKFKQFFAQFTQHTLNFWYFFKSTEKLQTISQRKKNEYFSWYKSYSEKFQSFIHTTVSFLEVRRNDLMYLTVERRLMWLAIKVISFLEFFILLFFILNLLFIPLFQPPY